MISPWPNQVVEYVIQDIPPGIMREAVQDAVDTLVRRVRGGDVAAAIALVNATKFIPRYGGDVIRELTDRDVQAALDILAHRARYDDDVAAASALIEAIDRFPLRDRHE